MKRRFKRIVTDVLSLCLGLLVIAPLLYGIFGAFKTPG